MKKLYSLTTFALALTLTSLSSLAQTFSGGTYTALRTGHWTPVGAELPIWATTPPPTKCANCHVIISDGITVTMNAAMTLSGSSLLDIGTAASTLTTSLVFPFSSSTTPPTPFDGNSLYNRVNLFYGDPVNIDINNSTSSIDASTTGANDGVFLAVPTPQGNSPFSFISRVGTAAQFPNSTSVGGPSTLSSVGTLPIVLSDFEAALDNGSVDLTWITQLEINSDHFVIQRSTNAGTKWDNMGTVAAHGNSSSPLNYSYTDKTAAAGTSEYRLELVDKDGKYAYSAVKTVRNGLIGAVSVFPNPAHDYVNITLGGTAASATIRLFNQSGQLLQEKNVTNAAGTTVALAVNTYSQGTYLLVVTSADGSKQVTSLLITK
jgi:hypothetical protein